MTSPLRTPLLDARALATSKGHTLTRFSRPEAGTDALYTTAACTTCGGTVTAKATSSSTYCFGSAADRACQKGSAS